MVWGGVVGCVVDSPNNNLEGEGQPVPHSHHPAIPGSDHRDLVHAGVVTVRVLRVIAESRNATDEYR